MPSPDEIAAIDHFRDVLLRAFDAAGVTRPGQRARGPVPPTPGPGAPAGVAAAGATPATPDLPPPRSIEDLLAELDALVGLAEVKADVRRLTSLLRIQKLREARGMPTIETSHHLVFTGNPGTGKTTVARLLSQILRTLGVVSRGHLVETDRSHLVAGFVGQTATRTREVMESALGGTLLIDEAYALARGSEQDFGREAIDTIVKFMEDHRDDLAVIAAGYPEEMAELIDANPGLQSRFTRTIEFPDYTTAELVAIFRSMGDRSRYQHGRRGDRPAHRAHRRRAAHAWLRQRPVRAQRLRSERRAPGRAPGRRRGPDRRAADHAHRRRHRVARRLTPFAVGSVRWRRRGRGGGGARRRAARSAARAARPSPPTPA